MSKSDFEQKIYPNVHKTIERLFNKKFPQDPLVPGQFSKIASIVSSAYKRHGFILEHAILTRLIENKKFLVWEDQNFGVSASAENLVSTFIDRESDANLSDLPYLSDPQDQVRHIQVDAIVYRKEEKSLVSYEIKRGNGTHDAGKKRSMKRDLLIQQTLLRSYGQNRGLEIKEVDSKIIFYYGQCSLPKPYSLTKNELDAHFGFKIQEYVEVANSLFSRMLTEEISEILASSNKNIENQMDVETNSNQTQKHNWIRKIFRN